jgi:Relaxase/Mobilisation nuclease domain
MVAKIKIGKSIRGILYYNEQKVSEGEANLILASGFAGDIDKMNFENKVQRFKHLTELKPSVKTNALHITLNFEATEKIDNNKMQQIAIRYMELLGFGEQPFLVYKHNDVAHQHIHIATTSIQRDGKSINLHNIGRDISEPARKLIEKEFALVVAESKKYKPLASIKPINPEIVKYGRLPTKRAISNVVNAVVDNYKFTSIAELNAVLKQFNVTADRGHEDTEMFLKKGLQYSVLDNAGNKIGVPIKASSFYSKPTLRNIEMKFEKNIEARNPFRQDLMKRINGVLDQFNSISETTLLNELSKQGINLMLRKNVQGFIYGATFTDHINKTIFNGSDLGKRYSAKTISEIIGDDKLKPGFISTNKKQLSSPSESIDTKTSKETIGAPTLLSNLLGKTREDFAPFFISKKKKRKGLTR